MFPFSRSEAGTCPTSTLAPSNGTYSSYLEPTNTTDLNHPMPYFFDKSNNVVSFIFGLSVSVS